MCHIVLLHFEGWTNVVSSYWIRAYVDIQLQFELDRRGKKALTKMRTSLLLQESTDLRATERELVR